MSVSNYLVALFYGKNGLDSIDLSGYYFTRRWIGCIQFR